MRKCDCGEEKSRTAPACDLCMWRDGTTASETRIIDALRTAVEPIDVKRVASLCDTTERSVLRSVLPLVASGRVVKVEGPPTLYKLGERRKRMSKKKQPELEGFERPSIGPLDDAIAELVDAEAAFKEWKTRREEAQKEVDRAMLRFETELELDQTGGRSYTFQDGEMRHVAYLPPEEHRRKAKIVSRRIASEAAE